MLCVVIAHVSWWQNLIICTCVKCHFIIIVVVAVVTFMTAPLLAAGFIMFLGCLSLLLCICQCVHLKSLSTWYFINWYGRYQQIYNFMHLKTNMNWLGIMKLGKQFWKIICSTFDNYASSYLQIMCELCIPFSRFCYIIGLFLILTIIF